MTTFLVPGRFVAKATTTAVSLPPPRWVRGFHETSHRVVLTRRYRSVRSSSFISTTKNFFSSSSHPSENPLLRYAGIGGGDGGVGGGAGNESESGCSVRKIYRNLPPFRSISPSHVVPAVTHAIQYLEKNVLLPLEQAINNGTCKWTDIFSPLEKIEITTERVWGPVCHLVSVKNSDELREAHGLAMPLMVNFGLRVSQSEPIYKALKALQEGEQWSNLDASQKRIVKKKLQFVELSGISLPSSQRVRFNEISSDLSLSSKLFSDNILDAIKSWSLTVDTTENPDLKKIALGLPTSLLQRASHTYILNHPNSPSTPQEGPWTFTIDGPNYVALMENCTDRNVRETVHKSYIQKASTGKYNNIPVLKNILKLRLEQAHLLGYKNHSEVSFAQKMAKNKDQVLDLLNHLKKHAKDTGMKELQEVVAIASADDIETVYQWDVPFYSRRLQEQKFGFSEEEVKQYFPFKKVLNGLFEFAKYLFGISIKEVVSPEVPKWHEDVLFFLIEDDNTKEIIGGFYVDPYSRPEEKSGGAWMNVCCSRVIHQKSGKILQIPIAYLVCNSAPPTKDTVPLMTFREVETLFHEFGHGLQHLLTTVPYLDAAGINGIEWDAVELPSQFMENWCYHKKTILSLTEHVNTKESLPLDLYEKIKNARTFRAASKLLRQIFFGLLDLEVHTHYDPITDKPDIFEEVQKQVYQNTETLPILPMDFTLCSFSHIFSGGYACGYYSYKWAEVLSADAFAAFKEVGIENDEEIRVLGRRFRDSVLSLGGSLDPLEIFKQFRGKPPNPDSLLKDQNLI